jgi:hypothetical protein
MIDYDAPVVVGGFDENDRRRLAEARGDIHPDRRWRHEYTSEGVRYINPPSRENTEEWTAYVEECAFNKVEP